MIEDEWTPSDDDTEWMKNHLAQMQVGDTWGVADAILRKDIDNVLTVTQASPASILPLERIRKVCAQIGYKLITDGAKVIHDPQAAAQESAQEWACTHKDCEERIVNFDLENAVWNQLDDDFSWRVMVTHETPEGDTHEVALSPMDYNLVAGDELFFTWDGMRVLEREEIIEMADNDTLMANLGAGFLIIMPTRHEGVVVPPHLRGLIFYKHRDEEE